jgi:transposase InsO family protein
MLYTLFRDILYTFVFLRGGRVAWRRVEVSEERVRFVVLANRGEHKHAELCREFGISRPTGYLWLKRYRGGGIVSVAEASRRPHSFPTRTSAPIEQRIIQLRRERPDWGARKLSVLLNREGIAVLPGTLHRVLLRHGLVRDEDRRQAATGRFEREQPNQLWQMDFKSPKGWGQPVGPLSIIDDASRYLVALEGTWTTRAEAVRERLEAAFADCGVPEAMLMDHGVPWWNTKSAGGWTQLSIWLMKQGVQLLFSGIRHPQTQGKVERFHLSLEMGRRRRGLPQPELHQSWLDQFRHEYNHLRPHQALGMRTPAELWSKSDRRYDPHPPVWQYPPGAEIRRLEAHGALNLKGVRWQISRLLAGEMVQLERIEQRILVFYRNTLIREIDLAGQGSTIVEPWPEKPKL